MRTTTATGRGKPENGEPGMVAVARVHHLDREPREHRGQVIIDLKTKKVYL